MRRGLIAVIVTLVVLSLAVPAVACGCDSRPLDELISDADTVFAITPIGRGEIVEPGPMTVEVTRVYKGDVGPTVEVWATEGPAACGIVPDQGSPVGLLAAQVDGKARIGTCLPQFSVADIEEILGHGHDPGTTLAMTAPVTSQPYVLGALAVLGSIAGLAIARHRRRRGLP